MSKVSTNISLDAELKKESQALFADLGVDLSTAVTIFLKQCLRSQGFPFPITKAVPNRETVEAMNEYYAMKAHPELYKRYETFGALLDEVRGDA